MGKLHRRKCEMKKSDLKFRVIASKAIFPPETHCRVLTILNPNLEATWREVLIDSGFQVVDNLEIQTSNYFKKGELGWTATLNEKVGAFVEKYTKKKNEYLIKVRPCQVENNDNMENLGDGEGENVLEMDVDEVKIEIEGVSNEYQEEEEDEEAEDGFLVPKISNVRSLNEENGEEPEEDEELDDHLVRQNFGKISNSLLLRTKAELEKLKTRDPERWRRAVSTAPACWGFLQAVLDVPE